MHNHCRLRACTGDSSDSIQVLCHPQTCSCWPCEQATPNQDLPCNANSSPRSRLTSRACITNTGSLRQSLRVMRTRLTCRSVSLSIFIKSEKVQQAASIHGLEGDIVLVDHRVGHVQFEALQAHDPLLQAVPGQQPVHIHCVPLA